MSRYNVEYDGKWACFSSISEGFITPFMEKEVYKEWLEEEYNIKINSLYEVKKDIDSAIFEISLNRTKEEALECFKECGLDEKVCEELFYKMQVKYYKPYCIDFYYYKCPNCGQVIKKNTKECPEPSCCLNFFWK